MEHILNLKTLDPNISSLEEYLSTRDKEEFNNLLDIADSDLSDLNDNDLIDITTLAVNIYSSEMDIDPLTIINDDNIINVIVKRFLLSIVIFSLIKKGIIEKTDTELITLYKDVKFKSTKKGEIIGSMCY